MRRKYNDLLAKRAGMLAEAETLLKDGKREDYKSKMAEIGNINDEITEVKAFIDEQDRQFLERKDDLSVTIADDGIGGRLAITRFKLAYRLADHGAADFAAADNGEHVIKIR